MIEPCLVEIDISRNICIRLDIIYEMDKFYHCHIEAGRSIFYRVGDIKKRTIKYTQLFNMSYVWRDGLRPN